MSTQELHPEKKDKLYSHVLAIAFWILIFLPLVMCFIAVAVIYRGGHINLPTVVTKSSESSISSIPITSLSRNAEGYSEDICWNQVYLKTDKYYWLNGCKGRRGATICSEVLSYLSSDELENYSNWVKTGKKPIEGCEISK